MLYAPPPALVALLQPSTKPATPAQAQKIAEQVITQESLKGYLTFIASDALQGRDTPSQGLDTAAEFLAFNLKRFGVKPGGDKLPGSEMLSYFQKIPMVKAGFDATKTSLVQGETTLRYGESFAVAAGQGSVTGELAVILKERGTTDVKGKIVLIGPDAEDSVVRECLDEGAVAALRVLTSATWWRRQAGMIRTQGGWRMERTPFSAPAPSAPSLALSPEAGNALLDKGGKSVTVSVERTVERTYTQNVVGIIEGSDPALKSEYVAIGAHYDHVGVSTRPGGEDKIFNGADDDGSGTTAILAIAEAAVKVHPKRSLIFVWHAGEEKGLDGSSFFTDKPTVPIGQITAQLNIDMIGRSKPAGDTKRANRDLSGPNSIYVIGTTMMSSELGKLIHETNAKYLKLDYDPKYDAPDDPNRFFFRSDHYNYARKGIPICFWFDGVHEDYHQVGDEVSKIDFAKMEKITRTVYLTALNVGNLPKRPTVDKPLDR